MMRWKLNTLIGQLRDVDPKAAEYREIHKETGIATSTIALIAKGSKRVDIDVADRLLNFFSAKLGKQLTTQDLLEFMPDRKE
jgi:transcriptional regulator with XRE-family HTH domain